MPSIHDSIKDDDVCGEIVGEIKIKAGLFYGGRRQGKDVYVVNEVDAIALLEARMHSLLVENPLIYRERGCSWEIRFVY